MKPLEEQNSRERFETLGSIFLGFMLLIAVAAIPALTLLYILIWFGVSFK